MKTNYLFIVFLIGLMQALGCKEDAPQIHQDSSAPYEAVEDPEPPKEGDGDGGTILMEKVTNSSGEGIQGVEVEVLGDSGLVVGYTNFLGEAFLSLMDTGLHSLILRVNGNVELVDQVYIYPDTTYRTHILN